MIGNLFDVVRNYYIIWHTRTKDSAERKGAEERVPYDLIVDVTESDKNPSKTPSKTRCLAGGFAYDVLAYFVTSASRVKQLHSIEIVEQCIVLHFVIDSLVQLNAVLAVAN